MTQPQHSAGRSQGGRLFPLYMTAGALMLLAAAAASVSFGAADMSLATAWGAVFGFNPDISEHQVIRALRLPRTLAGIVVGASLAVCGAVMQGTTRNPLADSGLMGISSGAACGIAVSLALVPGGPYLTQMMFSCIGAALATSLTYLFASAGGRGMTPQRLVLAGLSISMLFGALTSAIAIKYRIGKEMIHWTSGSTASISWIELAVAMPLFALGIGTALAISRSVTLLSMGDDVASGLGLQARRIRLIATLAVLTLTGLAVVIVGPIGFVGLIIPHLARFLVGADYRYIIPMSAIYGAGFLVLADLFGRLYNRPHETPLGIIFAVIGVPCFLYIARKIRRETQ